MNTKLLLVFAVFLLLLLASCTDAELYKLLCDNPDSLKEKISCWMMKEDIVPGPGNFDSDNSSDNSEVMPSCFDSDGGDFYNSGTLEAEDNKGKVTKYNDYCEGDFMLVEYDCFGNTIRQKKIPCGGDEPGVKEHCKNGACISRKSGCYDSDGGHNYAKVGFVQGYNVYGDFIIDETDDCINKRDLVEIFCTDKGFFEQESHTCEPGTECKDGACVRVS